MPQAAFIWERSTYISDKSTAYQGPFVEWSYWGQESDSLTYASSGGSYVLGSYSGVVNASL
jgi:hypothetical protein